jgi:hypothetical protein
MFAVANGKTPGNSYGLRIFWFIDYRSGKTFDGIGCY